MVPAGVLPAGKPRSDRIRPAVRCGACASCCCATPPCWRCTACCWCSSRRAASSQELHTTAWDITLSTLAMGNVAFCCTTGPCTNLLMLYRLVWQPAAPDAGHALRTIVAQQLHKMGKVWYTDYQQILHRGRAERGNAKLPVDASAGATRVTAARVTRRGIIENFGGCFRLKARPAAEKGKNGSDTATDPSKKVFIQEHKLIGS